METVLLVHVLLCNCIILFFNYTVANLSKSMFSKSFQYLQFLDVTIVKGIRRKCEKQKVTSYANHIIKAVFLRVKMVML